MAEARTEVAARLKLRSRAAAVCAAGYVVALASFWLIGAAAYLRLEHGPLKLLGLAYFPILLLPVLGHGMLGTLHIGSSIWLWWFGLQMLLGAAAIWLYPYERPGRAARTRIGPNKQEVSGGAGARSRMRPI
jgi:hypothetical protein